MKTIVVAPASVLEGLDPPKGEVVYLADNTPNSVLSAQDLSHAAFILWLGPEGPPPGRLGELILIDFGTATIVVMPGHWDGFSHREWSGRCRGVIEGFGTNGLRAAIDFFATQ